MLGDGLSNSGTQGSYFRYQYASLKLLELIANGIAALPGVDYEARTTQFEVIAGPTPPGAGYSVGDFLVRYDIINVTTGIVTVTVWFNQTLQTTLAGAGNPNPADLTPISASLSVTVLNPFNLEATQLAVLAALGPLATEATLVSILGQLDVALSTRASEATLSTRASAANQTTLGAQTTMLNDGADTALITPAGELNVFATAQPGTDIGDVTVNNGAGAAAVNIQDGGNSLTIDAVSLPLPTGAATEATLSSVDTSLNNIETAQTNGTQQTKITDGVDIALVTAAGELNVFNTPQPGTDIGDVTINNGAGAAAVNIQDGGNSITVDYATTGPGTAVGALRVELPTDGTGVVGLNAGSAIIGKVGIDQTTPGTTNLVQNKEMPDATATFAPSSSNSVAYVASQVVKASAGVLYGFTGYNSLASDQFIQVHNTAAVPADASVPIITFIARASSNFSFDTGKFGMFFSTGITICNSTTGPTKTLGAANCWFNVLYT